ELTPEQRRRRTLDALVRLLQALAQKNPVLLVFEDAHWSDPSSLQVIERMVEQALTLRVLLIVTCRPEFDPPWKKRPNVTALSIERLEKPEMDAMIDGIAGVGRLPPSIRADIIERTDGIPLFVEEMTKAVLEARSEGAAGHVAVAIPSPA